PWRPAWAGAGGRAGPSPRLEAQTMALRPEIPRSMRASIPRSALIRAAKCEIVVRPGGRQAKSAFLGRTIILPQGAGLVGTAPGGGTGYGKSSSVAGIQQLLWTFRVIRMLVQ